MLISAASVFPLVCLLFGSHFYTATSNFNNQLSGFDFNVQSVDAEGNFQYYHVPVFTGQRISDAADDFSRRQSITFDVVFREEIFRSLCQSVGVKVECESMDRNTVLAKIVMHEVKASPSADDVVAELSIFVRKGYSAKQQAFYACSYYNCSYETYSRVEDRISRVMEREALVMYSDDPFALMEGPSLSHLMTYCLSALQDDEDTLSFCSNVNSVCEIEALCPRNSKLHRTHTFCKFLLDNNNTGSDFFHLFQSAYNVPNCSLVPTLDFYNNANVFSYAMVLQSKLMAIDNYLYRLLRIVTNSYLRESFSSHATATTNSEVVGRSKVQFHLNQLEYLADLAERKSLHINSMSSRAEYRTHDALEAYLSGIVRHFKVLSNELKSEAYAPLLAARDGNQLRMMSNALYNRNVYHRPFFPEGRRSHMLALPKLNPLNDEEVAKINEQFSAKHIVVVDDFLHPEILEELYQYCVQSTIWHVSDKSLFVGSYWDDGLSHPLLIEVAKEIATIFPIVRDLPLVHMWAYNFDSKKTESRRSGIDMHMDSALVNLNLWLTPNEANLDPESGGLVVWLKDLFSAEHNPTNKVFRFDEVQDPEFGRAFLNGSEHLNVTVPYKRNRVVIFNSALWHTTDEYNFAGGHENRRINLTFLFGKNRNIIL